MSNDNVIEFINKNCKNQEHSLCHGKWSGFGINVVCECTCHEKKFNVADGFEGPDSAASSQEPLEFTKVDN